MFHNTVGDLVFVLFHCVFVEKDVSGLSVLT